MTPDDMTATALTPPPGTVPPEKMPPVHQRGEALALPEAKPIEQSGGPWIKSVIDGWFGRSGGGVPTPVLLELDMTSLAVRAWDLNHARGDLNAIPVRLPDGSVAWGVEFAPTPDLIISALIAGGHDALARQQEIFERNGGAYGPIRRELDSTTYIG